MIGLFVVLGLVGLLILLVVVAYNGLVFWRNQVKNAWAQIDVQLKRRYDLIPNLVETVKGYAQHERETLEKVIQARQQAMSAQTPHDQAQAENILSGTLKSLFALSENYPDLKANQNFLELQEELTSTENKISFARQFYNDTTTKYNVKIQSIPTNILAGLFNFKQEELFETEAGEEREPVKVKF